jgi:DHA1 family bicyclomycin/chloramphenicol resistance-like MFS transporter
MTPAIVVVMLALLLGVQPVSTDLYLPALPALSDGFGAPMAQVQFTLSALLLSFGCSQLVWGPLSDRFGRRPILLIGLVVYLVAAVACVLAPTLNWLIFWRVLLGVAMGAAVMTARAVVRDLFEPAEGARVLSTGMSGLAVLACVSGPIGGLLTDLAGWRGALAALAVFGACALVLVAFYFKETLPQPRLDALQARTLVNTWLHIVKHPSFLTFSVLAAASYAGLFTFLAASAFVLIKLRGLSLTAYGLMMASTAFSYMCGTFLCRQLLRRLGLNGTVAVAAGLSLSGGVLMAGLAWLGVETVWAIMLPIYLFLLAHGVIQPCGQSGTVGPFPESAGAASALNGFLMMVTAFGMGGWLSAHMDGSSRPLIAGILFWSLVIALVGWALVPRLGRLSRSKASPA